MINIITIYLTLTKLTTYIYLFWSLESKSNAAMQTSWLRLLADELNVAVKIDALLLLESALDLKWRENWLREIFWTQTRRKNSKWLISQLKLDHFSPQLCLGRPSWFVSSFKISQAQDSWVRSNELYDGSIARFEKLLIKEPATVWSTVRCSYHIF